MRATVAGSLSLRLALKSAVVRKIGVPGTEDRRQSFQAEGEIVEKTKQPKVKADEVTSRHRRAIGLILTTSL